MMLLPRYIQSLQFRHSDDEQQNNRWQWLQHKLTKEAPFGFARLADTARINGHYGWTQYLSAWIDSINGYISQEELYWTFDPKLHTSELMLPGRIAILPINFLDENFFIFLTEEKVELIKKHDELVLELLGYGVTDIPICYFKGNQMRAFLKLQTLNFPNKLDTVLEHFDYLHEPQNPLQEHITPWAPFKEDLKKRLLSEFPDKTERINQHFAPEPEVPQSEDEDNETNDY